MQRLIMAGVTALWIRLVTAAEVAPDRVYRNILPKASIQYRFVARVPGAFMYHCGTAAVALHIANGM
jgi:nitrite reductase (NO-forming)